MTFQHTPDSHLDVYLNGIRQEFGRLNQELQEAKSQREEYKKNYTNQAKELQELRQTVLGTSKGHIACQHCKGQVVQSCGDTNDNLSPVLSPVSSSCESYFSIENSFADPPYNSTEVNRSQEQGDHGDNLPESYMSDENEIRPKDSTISGNTPLFLQSDVTSITQHKDSRWNVEFNRDTKVALKLNLVHTLMVNAVITYAAFSMDGKYLATVSLAGVVHIFNVRTGERLSVMRDLYRSEKDEKPTSWCLGFSPDSKFLATGQSDGEVKIWIVSKKRVRNTFKQQGPVRGLDFSPNGQCVALACDQTIVIRRLRDGFSRVLKKSDFYFPWTVGFSKDGRYLASGGNPQRNRITIWDVRMGKCIAGHGVHNEVVRDLVFTPDGKGLLTASWDKMVIHWDVSWLKSTHGDSTDGRKEVISTSTRDSAGGLKETSRFVGHKHYVYAVSTSPDGNWVASGSWDETVRIWNAHTATLQCVLHGHAEVRSVDFSRIGNYLAISDGKGQVTIWNFTNV